MDVISTCPIRIAIRPWLTQGGQWMLTVVCKATYALLPGQSPLHTNQDDPNEEDTFWDDDPHRSLSSPSDLCPFKKRADILLVGSVYAPRKLPARSILARLIVNDVDKSVEAFCDRAWTLEGQLHEGPKVVKVPLRYERAAGGPDSWNPAGVRLNAPPNPFGMVTLPNLQPPGLHVDHRDVSIDPIGFGPIPASWPTRKTKLAALANVFSATAWYRRPLPDGLDPAFFNVAPRDQQVATLREDERIVLENLLPTHERLVTNLPGIKPRAFIELAGHSPTQLAFVCDTLFIDSDRSSAYLVWRATVPIRHPDMAGRVLVSLDDPAVRWPKPVSKTIPLDPDTHEEMTDITDTYVDVDSQQVTQSGSAPVLPFISTPPTLLSPPQIQTQPVSPRFTDEDTVTSLPFPIPQKPLPFDHKTDTMRSAKTAGDQQIADEPSKAPASETSTIIFRLGDRLGRPAMVTPALSQASVSHEHDSVFVAPQPSAGFAAPMQPPLYPQPVQPPLYPQPLVAPPVYPQPVVAPAYTPPLVTPNPAPPLFALQGPPPLVAPQPPLVAPPPPSIEAQPAPAALPEEPPMVGPLATPEMVEQAKVPQTPPPPPPEQTPPAPAQQAEPDPFVTTFPIEKCAAVAAQIAQRRIEVSSIFNEHELTPEKWKAVDQHWTDAIRIETARGRTTLLTAYDTAYIAQLERDRGPITVNDYARLVVGSERGNASAVLEDLKLPRGALLRIERVWLKRIADESALAQNVRGAIETMREE